MSLQWLRWLVLLGFGLVSPAAVAAHGGNVKIEHVAALDGDGAPWLLQLSDGLAIREAEDWRFVCPAVFEASSIVQALSLGSETAWVMTARGIFRLSSDGVPEPRAGRCADSPIELVAHRGAVYALGRDSERKEFIVCELGESGPREVYASASAVNDLISDGEQLWLARTVDEAIELEPLGGGESRTYRAGPHRAARLAFVGGSLYASLIDFGRTTLARLRPTSVEILFEATSPLFGPIESRGRAVAGSHGQLFALEGLELWPIDTALKVVDMDGLAGRGFAFTDDGALYEMPESARTTPALFEIDYVRPPLPSSSDACFDQWLRFEIDRHGAAYASADSGAPAVDAGEEPCDAAPAEKRARAGGCSIGGRIAATSPALALCVASSLLASRRLRRRRLGNHCSSD